MPLVVPYTAKEAVEIGERLEDARAKLGLNQDEIAKTVWPREKKRTRYNTVLLVLKNGGFPRWSSLGPLVEFFDARGYPAMYVLFGRWEPSRGLPKPGPAGPALFEEPPEPAPPKRGSAGLQQEPGALTGSTRKRRRSDGNP